MNLQKKQTNENKLFYYEICNSSKRNINNYSKTHQITTFLKQLQEETTKFKNITYTGVV